MYIKKEMYKLKESNVGLNVYIKFKYNIYNDN